MEHPAQARNFTILALLTDNHTFLPKKIRPSPTGRGRREIKPEKSGWWGHSWTNLTGKVGGRKAMRLLKTVGL